MKTEHVALTNITPDEIIHFYQNVLGMHEVRIFIQEEVSGC
jgi:catechol 2,3-dioxygenase-like lactoylglutathione lyase family enzyme